MLGSCDGHYMCNSGLISPLRTPSLATAGVDEHGVDLALRQAAEAEMRRVLDDEPATKRLRTGSGHIGRFHYGSPAQLSDCASVAGFLVTCHMGREHSALKEVGSVIVEKAAALLGMDGHVSSSGNAASAAPGAQGPEEAPAAPAAAGADDMAPTGAATPPEGFDLPQLHSIKLACRGVLALKLSLPPESNVDASALVLKIVESIVADVEGGVRPRFRFVQRVAPMQTTTVLGAEQLRAAAARLAASVVADEAKTAGAASIDDTAGGDDVGAQDNAQAAQLTFAVAYVGRGSDSKAQPSSSSNKTKERSAMVGAIAGGFADALKSQYGRKTKVNLKVH